MKLSIIVPAFNEEKLLPATLGAIREAAAVFIELGCDWELIVCDNNSTDRTAAVAREASAIVVFEPVNQIARARNAGAAAATGEWLVFIDADSLPGAPLFRAMVEHMRDPDVLAGGCLVRQDVESLAADAITALWNHISRTLKWVAGSFIFCRAAAFRELGGFSAELFAAEELDLSRRLKKLARQHGQRMVIITEHRLLTSGRKLRLYSKREQVSLLLRSLFLPFLTLRRRQAFWYDGRR